MNISCGILVDMNKWPEMAEVQDCLRLKIQRKEIKKFLQENSIPMAIYINKIEDVPQSSMQYQILQLRFVRLYGRLPLETFPLGHSLLHWAVIQPVAFSHTQRVFLLSKYIPCQLRPTT